MSDEDAPKKDDGDAGSPAWVMTFADLMSLLMCFFVLLLSFSEMDVQKYKQLSGSMAAAFGVQRDIPAHEIPKGTSVVAKEFRPGKPQPTVKKQIRQESTDTERKKLDKQSGFKPNKAKEATEKDAKKLASQLGKEIKSGEIEIETHDRKIIIRVLEKGAFPSGLAQVNRNFMPSIQKIRTLLKDVKGDIKVLGHTDDIPIHSERFNSNWELSAARAGSVVHHLTKGGELSSDRFEIIGLADTKPRVPNISRENRAKNRRVEIIIQQGKDEEIQIEEVKAINATIQEKQSGDSQNVSVQVAPAKPEQESAP